MTTIDDFHKLDIRVGKIVHVDEFPEARMPAFKLSIDFGELGVKQSSAQLTELYKKEELVGRQVIAIVNFPPRKVANFNSEVLVLGAVSDKHGTILLKPERDAVLGDKIE